MLSAICLNLDQSSGNGLKENICFWPWQPVSNMSDITGALDALDVPTWQSFRHIKSQSMCYQYFFLFPTMCWRVAFHQVVQCRHCAVKNNVLERNLPC